MRGKRPSRSSDIDEVEEEDEEGLSSLSDSSNEEEEEDDEEIPSEDIFVKQEKCRAGRKKGQSYRSSYDSDTLKAAYHAVVDEGMAVYAASKKYNVPQSTLRDRVLGRVAADVTSSGPPTIFTPDEEAGIASYVRLFADIGHPLSRNKVRQLAGDLAAQLQRRGFIDGKVLSLRWYYKLIDRFPDMQSQKFANTKLQEIGYGYYKKLAELFEENGLEGSSKRLHIFDKISVQTGTSSLKMICRNLSDENIDVAVMCNEGADISLLGCFSASGKKVPPCFVLPNNSDSPSRKTISKIQHGVIVKYSPNGKETPQILKDYFEHHFSQFVKVGPSAKKHVIFYNSHVTSIPLTVWLWGQYHNIEFFPLPLHRQSEKEFLGLKKAVCLDKVSELFEEEQKVLEEKSPGAKFKSLDSLKILSRLYSSLPQSLCEQTFNSLGIFPLPARHPGMLRFDKILEDLKRDPKQKQKRQKRKNANQIHEASMPRRKKAKLKPKANKSRVNIKKVSITEKIRHPVPVDWTGITAQDEYISVPVTSSSHEDNEYKQTAYVSCDSANIRSESLENGVTLDCDSDPCVKVEGTDAYHVYIQGAECDTDNVPVLVAEEVIIMETTEDV